MSEKDLNIMKRKSVKLAHEKFDIEKLIKFIQLKYQSL